VVLSVADDEFRIFIAKVRGVDGLDRPHHGGLSLGVVHIRGDDVIKRDRAR
jgi:hypothetical protein